MTKVSEKFSSHSQMETGEAFWRDFQKLLFIHPSGQEYPAWPNCSGNFSFHCAMETRGPILRRFCKFSFLTSHWTREGRFYEGCRKFLFPLRHRGIKSGFDENLGNIFYLLPTGHGEGVFTKVTENFSPHFSPDIRLRFWRNSQKFFSSLPNGGELWS